MDCCRSFTTLLSLSLFSAVLASAQGSATPAEISDLAPGKVRHTIEAQRALIASHPHDPSGYVNLAYSLTDAGSNDEAREEVAKAVAVAPHAAFAFHAQAWVLHHNAIGVDYGKGFDYDASLASFRKAIELDPNDLDLRQSLANLLEFDRNGIRYASGAKLNEAIDILRDVKARQKTVQTEVEDNLIIDLFYAGRFGEVMPELSNLPSSPVRDGVAVAAIAATKGPGAAVDFANQIGGDEQKKKDALNFAAAGLWNMRLYPQATAMLTASLPDAPGSGELAAKIQLFRNLRPYKSANLPATDPRSPVQRLIVGVMSDTLTEEVIAECVSRHAFVNEADWKRSLPQANTIAGVFRNLSRQTGLPQVVVQDIVLGTMKITKAPSNEGGSRIVVQFAGVPSQSFFVMQEDGGYKVVAASKDLGNVGTAALYLLHSGREAEAVSLLNWKREMMQREQGEDPLGGLLFARLWTSGKSSGAQSIEVAAASLVQDKTELASLLSQIQTAHGDAKTDAERENLDLLLASMYLRVGDRANAKLVAERLLHGHPDSMTAIRFAGKAYKLNTEWEAWRSLVEARLKRQPNDRSLLLESANEAAAEGDFTQARKALHSILASGNGTAEDYNQYAWLSLFVAQVDDDALAAAQQATLLSKNSNSSYLHTLACLDAARGQTAEARQLLLEAMSRGAMEEPNGVIWYGFGRIYEQYGLMDAAARAYRRVSRPEDPTDPVDTYVLAQARLKMMRAS